MEVYNRKKEVLRDAKGNSMETKIYTIADGVILHTVKTDKFKTDYLSLNFVNSLNREKNAFYSLISKVLYRGTKNYTNMSEISKRLDYLYASSISTRIVKRGDCQYISFSSNMLSKDYVTDGTDILKEVSSLLTEIIFEPYLVDGCFCKEYVESEKKNLADHIRSLINSKSAYAKHRCIEEMCKNELYSISVYGEEETVWTITPEALYDAYKEFLKTSHVEIYFIGNADTDALSEILKKAFAKTERYLIPMPKTEVIRKCDEPKQICEELPVAQGKLLMGFRSGKVLSDGDHYKFAVFTELFGGTSTSKLFMNVREKMSLCYYCGASALSMKGLMIVSGGIDPANKEIAEKEILHQLELTQAGDISENELSNAKKSLVSDHRAISDSQGALEAWCISRYRAGLSDNIDEEIDNIMSVSADDVVECAKGVSLDTVFFLKGTAEGGDEDDE
ncbi:MAG: insulinase family protein [Ruminococcaceae bacterium]|nr:insulinase family protein [Oscillospiraceae bacterium]